MPVKFCSLHLEKMLEPSCGNCFVVKDERGQLRAELHEMYLRNKVPEERIGYSIIGLAFYSKAYPFSQNLRTEGYSSVEEALRAVEVFYNQL